MTTSATSMNSTTNIGTVGPIIRRVHPHAFKMRHGSLPNGELALSRVDAHGLLLDLLVALMPNEEIRPRHEPVPNLDPIDCNTITTGELIERLSTASRQRDDLKSELKVIAHLALIASTLADQEKNLLISVIHDRADNQSKKPTRT